MSRYLIIAIPVLLLTPFTAYVAAKVVWTAIRVKAVLIGGRRYAFADRPGFVSFVVAVWLLLTMAMLLASVALLSELPSIINQNIN
ncbi:MULTISPECIES: hypothetical protein [unclassified Bradyrhizobium]|uniref:hypothetical protein n=1 Tax=unclassified Bradyrhizobium TaxID=2631580 RepID=UPI002FF03E0E